MFEKPQVMAVASALAAHASARQSAIARNVANADTPGYRAIDTDDFAKTFNATRSAGMRQTRAGHMLPDRAAEAIPLRERSGAGHLSPNGNSVSLETEMVKAAEVRKEHDMALAIYRKSLDILRASLGRR
ncbi:MAG: FlgB family protein [Rhodobacteraceae bacterium]|nr:FlgB family protein [Paracoccaceae bacterium]MCP5341307.1 FlgB family protein [Paracoccaceae bacterium]